MMSTTSVANAIINTLPQMLTPYHPLSKRAWPTVLPDNLYDYYSRVCQTERENSLLALIQHRTVFSLKAAFLIASVTGVTVRQRRLGCRLVSLE